MIKIDALYQLYLYSISAKIRRNEEKIAKYSAEVEVYLPQLSAIKPLIEIHIDYHDLLNGRVSSLPKDVLANATTALKYANIIIEEYFSIRSTMNSLSAENKHLESSKISIKVYKEILRKCNNKIGEYLLFTGKPFSSPFLGEFRMKLNEDPNRPNWGKSNRNKQAILDRGGIPYKKEDEERCIAAGIPYHGEKWVDKTYEHGLLYLDWRPTTFLKNLIPESIRIRFNATKGRCGIVTRLSDFYKTNVDYSIYEKQVKVYVKK